MKVLPTISVIGAEIAEIDLAKDIWPNDRAKIRSAWLDRGIIFFRGQKLTDSDLIRFSRHFGVLEVSPAGAWSGRGGSSAPEFPEIWVISNVKENGVPIGSLGDGEAEWHTDMSYVPVPPDASVLYSLEIPDSGGDTSFADMYAALETLPADLRRAIEGRTLNHDSSYTSAGELRYGASEVTDVTRAPGARHPIIRRHDESGRDALYLGRRRNAYIVGLPVEESERLLDQLWHHCTQPQFVYRHRWRVGDLLMWDNRCVIHRRDAFGADQRRIMHRTQIKGLVASAPATN